MATTRSKFKIQEDQYEFPYHYIPYFDKNGVPTRTRVLKWGYKYLCYLLHIKKIIESLKPRSVLEVGCGEARLLNVLDGSAERMVGTDLAEKPILFAGAFNPGIDFFVMDAKDLNEEFDIVVAMEVLEHIPDDEVNGFLNILSDRAKVGGHVIISTPTTVQPLNKKHYRHYTLKLFKEQLKSSGADLAIVNVDYVYRGSVITNLYFLLTNNRLWHWEIHFLNKVIWRYVWKNLRISNAKNGEDLVLTLQKKA